MRGGTGWCGPGCMCAPRWQGRPGWRGLCSVTLTTSFSLRLPGRARKLLPCRGRQGARLATRRQGAGGGGSTHLDFYSFFFLTLHTSRQHTKHAQTPKTRRESPKAWNGSTHLDEVEHPGLHAVDQQGQRACAAQHRAWQLSGRPGARPTSSGVCRAAHAWAAGRQPRIASRQLAACPSSPAARLLAHAACALQR